MAAASLGRAETKDEAIDAFSFLQINDLHYIDDHCERWFQAVVEQMKASAPEAKLCLMCGDLADTGGEKALASVKEIFGGLGVSLLPVPGNHDFTPMESREGYDAVFPGRLNYHIIHGGWQFLGLDTTMGTKYERTTISNATLEWLAAELPKLNRTAPTVVFTHFPLGENVTYRPLNAAALLESLLQLDVVAAFSGHWHGASERANGKSVLLTSRCCARVRNNADKSPLKGWFVCRAQADGTLTRQFHTFQAPADIPTLDVAAPKAKAN